MSSFYGNGGISSGEGTNGPVDYNDLLNKPIEQKEGTQDGPVIFENLPAGEYLVSGTYKYTEENEFSYDTPFLHVEVTEDEETGKKVVTFEKFVNGAWNKYIIVYDSANGSYELHTYTFNRENDKGIIYVPEGQLPTHGKEDTLYVTEVGIYRYIGDSYVSLSGSKNPVWEEI